MIAADFDLDLYDETRAQRYRRLARVIADPKKAALFDDVASRLEARLDDYYRWKREHSRRDYGATRKTCAGQAPIWL